MLLCVRWIFLFQVFAVGETGFEVLVDDVDCDLLVFLGERLSFLVLLLGVMVRRVRGEGSCAYRVLDEIQKSFCVGHFDVDWPRFLVL